MAENSKIEWTDHTFNPWMGCTKVSPACKHCYAERDMDHRYGKVTWGPNGTRVLTSDANWKLPLKWNREANAWQLHLAFCKRSGVADPVAEWARRDEGNLPAIPRRPRVFCASLADVFEDWPGPLVDASGDIICRPYLESENTPEFWNASDAETLKTDPQGWSPITMNDVRQRLFKLIDETPNLDWLLLTKRPENIRKMWPEYPYNACLTGDCPHERAEQCSAIFERENVWIGCSVENQEFADSRIPELLKCRDLAPVLFLSCEPLLGPVDLRPKAPESYGTLGKFYHSGQFDPTGSGPTLERVLNCFPRIDWVIAGGESGPGARPSHPDWFRSLRDQCDDADVPFHFKQWGEWTPLDGGGKLSVKQQFVTMGVDGRPRFAGDANLREFGFVRLYRAGKKSAGRALDGQTHDATPARW